jgi:nuclear RNA export factor
LYLSFPLASSYKKDGAEMGPVIGFDVVDESKQLPTWKKLYFCEATGQELVAKFIEQYFAIYDSDNRQQLLEAYHENALLSITATNNQHYTQDERY